MTLQLDLTPETERTLRAAAEARHQPVEEYLVSLVESALHPAIIPASDPARTSAEFGEWLSRLSQAGHRIPTIQSSPTRAKSSTMTMIKPAPPARCLVDTNILLRITQPEQHYPAQHRAVRWLAEAGTRLFTSFQNIAEYWNVSTRPADLRGSGLPHHEVEQQVRTIAAQFDILTEDREVFVEWLRLVTVHKVSGRQVHDARLVAHMHARNIPALLTSNTKDFTRYPGIQLLDPVLMP